MIKEGDKVRIVDIEIQDETDKEVLDMIGQVGEVVWRNDDINYGICVKVSNGKFESQLMFKAEELELIYDNRPYEEYHAVKYGDLFLSIKDGWGECKGVESLDRAYKGTYEQADRLAKLYGGKVKKVVTYIEDVEGYPE